MKKLNLQLGSIKEMLTKEQMKKVQGGYGCQLGCFVEGQGGTITYCPLDNCWFSPDENCMYCGQNFNPTCCDNTIWT